MKLVIVNENEAGQRLDKLLAKYLSQASKSFLYKMLRKKNITLNNKKASGNEKTVLHDEIRFFLSDETFEKFSSPAKEELLPDSGNCKLDIVYEDRHILLLNKPVNILSQKAKDTDVSINEQMLSYLLSSGQITAEELKSFRPAVCNRLDRNTSGLIVAGKSLAGLQAMSRVFKDRSLHKYYLCLVKGEIAKKRQIDGWLVKDERSNKAKVLKGEAKGALPIHTEYTPVAASREVTLLKVWLITGRSHQIRVHLASIGHPVIGDGKYGDPRLNRFFEEKHGVKHQLLHSYELVMPKMTGELSYLSGKSFRAEPPKEFARVIAAELPEFSDKLPR